MKNLTQSHWFPLVDLALALICALAWAFSPQWGWVTLLIALLPWTARLLAGQFPFQRTWLDLPMAVFLLTAGIGIWTAYDRAAAWEKFWWIVAAIRLYYALAAQPRRQFQVAALSTTGIAALLSAQFLLTYDWQTHPLMGAVDRLGSAWMNVRPALPLPVPEPDFIGGLAAMLAPLTLVLTIEARKNEKKSQFGVTLIIGSLLALGLLMSAERPAWLGLILAAGLWLGWQACRWLAERMGRNATTLAVIGIIVVSLAGLFLGVLLWQRYASHGSVPGRVEEIINGFHLALPYRLIGGGLRATSGLYSRYMLGIPFIFIPNIRNQYLNLAIEQGMFGLGALLLIFVGTLVGLYRNYVAGRVGHRPYRDPAQVSIRSSEHATDASQVLRSGSKNQAPSSGHLIPYKWALALGIIILAWHSLMEDVFYSNWGLIFLLILPGLAASLTVNAPSTVRSANKKWWALGLGAAAILLIVFFRPIQALWHANLGAVRMAQVQLEGWPDDLVTGEDLIAQIDPAESRFEQAIQTLPTQPTANYHLGLIATERRDFEVANTHLQTAHNQRPFHRGIRKALGYSYAWLGEIEAAGQTLSAIPEAAYELSIYAQWWASIDRPDLSAYATQTEIWLEQK